MKKLLALIALLGAAFAPSFAYSQAARTSICWFGTQSSVLGNANCIPVSAANPLPVSTSGGGVNGFTPNGTYANLTSTASSARVALPAASTVVVAYNTGTTAVSCKLGTSSVTAVANEDQIQPGGWFSYSVGSNVDIACINQAGDSTSNVVVLSGGSGLATGAGSGGVSIGASTFGAAFPATGIAPGFSISGLFQGWTGLTNGGVNYGLIGVVDNTGTQLNGLVVGTAGSASTQVVTVQGIASMTPLLVTPAANSAVNVAQVNGTTVLVNTGAVGTGSLRVAVGTDQATNAGAALVKGGVGVVNGGSTYIATAASQTAAVLQTSTGAAGDYLSHCVIYPTSTSPGVVTVFDSTNTAANSAILFPGGSSSLSNLAPIAVPVGAVSVNGAWKVTTGSAVSTVCFGKFS